MMPLSVILREPRLGKSLAGLLFVSQSLRSWTNREFTTEESQRSFRLCLQDDKQGQIFYYYCKH